MADDFHRLAPWIQQIAARFDERSRKKMGRKIAQSLRTLNAKRIAANVQPDGSAMEPRKKQAQRNRQTKRIRKGPRMFPNIRKKSNMTIRVTADHVEIGFNDKVARAANVHHYGLRDRIAHFRGAPSIRYPRRELLGFGPEDEAEIIEVVMNAIDA